jgi:predicted ester cyclase
MTNDEIRELARRFFQEVWNNRDEAAIDRYIAADAAGNDPTFGAGREAFRRQWRAWQAAFPDLHFQVEEIVAEGDTVVTRWTLTGTHTGAPFEDVEPSGAAIRVGGMSLDHIRDGMIVSGFDGWDELGFRRALGAL